MFFRSSLLVFALSLQLAAQTTSAAIPQSTTSIAPAKLMSTKAFVRKFFAIKDPVEVIRISLGRYPELAWLTGEVNATPEGKPNSRSGQTISETFFGAKHIEFDRTATGILLIKWIIEGNYTAFTQPQNAAVKLTRANFQKLRAYTRAILKTPNDIDAMITFMVINDLGKIKSIAEEIEKRAGIKDVDHDNLLLIALEKHPDLSPSFVRLPNTTQQMMIRGLRPKFNFGQFIQSEGLPANLSGLNGLDKQSLDFFLLHALADIGGAAGHVNGNGSLILTDPTYESFQLGIRAIESLALGQSEVAVYDFFLATKGRPFGLYVDSPRDRAIIRLLNMLRVSDPALAIRVATNFDSLPTNVKAILVKEMNLNGIGDGYAILLYYAPAMLSNILAYARANPTAFTEEKALQLGLTTLAQLYQEARTSIKQRTGDGVFTLLISKIAEAAKTPEQLIDVRFEIDAVEQNGEARLADPN